MQTVGNSTDGKLFVLVLHEDLVARDIELTIGDLYPGARVLVARSVNEAEATVPPGQIAAAFVQQDPDAIARTNLVRRVQADQGRIVLVGYEPKTDQTIPGWSVLPLPFSQDHVTAVLIGAIAA